MNCSAHSKKWLEFLLCVLNWWDYLVFKIGPNIHGFQSGLLFFLYGNFVKFFVCNGLRPFFGDF